MALNLNVRHDEERLDKVLHPNIVFSIEIAKVSDRDVVVVVVVPLNQLFVASALLPFMLPLKPPKVTAFCSLSLPHILHNTSHLPPSMSTFYSRMVNYVLSF